MSREPPLAFEEEDNPYRAPETQAQPPADEAGLVARTEAELVRQAYLKQEARIKAVGWLLFGYAGFMVSIALYFLAGASGRIVPLAHDPELADSSGLGAAALFGFGLGILGFWLGYGLLRWKPWARWGVLAFLSIHTIFAILILNPLLMLFSFISLYLILSSNGSVIFARRYQEYMAQTPRL